MRWDGHGGIVADTHACENSVVHRHINKLVSSSSRLCGGM